nr:MAG TPA: hypothetical protein [Bacteriophage sp.]
MIIFLYVWLVITYFIYVLFIFIIDISNFLV